ncbi:uncharacterized protein LOC105665222 isoform X1 [Ceratitis capitata]|uniref:uncharacterized protein LOC105665222 isoform X1 n=1 Tax=Ceratitis capitata TaxID=7213 RepID=UPI0006188E8D|nr:uncharacterized protein LOC105665222 isoform X1 [Ceratitis capitata]
MIISGLKRFANKSVKLLKEIKVERPMRNSTGFICNCNYTLLGKSNYQQPLSRKVIFSNKTAINWILMSQIPLVYFFFAYTINTELIAPSVQPSPTPHYLSNGVEVFLRSSCLLIF